jgi:hypothetical protein
MIAKFIPAFGCKPRLVVVERRQYIRQSNLLDVVRLVAGKLHDFMRLWRVIPVGNKRGSGCLDQSRHKEPADHHADICVAHRGEHRSSNGNDRSNNSTEPRIEAPDILVLIAQLRYRAPLESPGGRRPEVPPHRPEGSFRFRPQLVVLGGPSLVRAAARFGAC